MSQAVHTALFTPLWIRMIFWEQAVPPDPFPSLSLPGCTCGKAEVRPGSVKSTTPRVFPRLKPCLPSMPTEWEMLKTENSFSCPGSQECVCKSSFPGGTLGSQGRGSCAVPGGNVRTHGARPELLGRDLQISLCCRHSELRVLLGSIPMGQTLRVSLHPTVTRGSRILVATAGTSVNWKQSWRVCPLREVVIYKPKQSAVPRGVWDW